MAEGSYRHSAFCCSSIAEFLDKSVCENTEGGWEPVEQDERILLEPRTKAMLPHPLLRPLCDQGPLFAYHRLTAMPTSGSAARQRGPAGALTTGLPAIMCIATSNYAMHYMINV